MTVERRRFLMGAGVVLTLGVTLPLKETLALDQVPSPPRHEEFVSPAGNYVLVLTAPEDWQTGKPEGELLKIDGGARSSLWKRALPQQWRARFALVSDGGRVLLLDDWWNTRSGHAVMVLAPDGQAVASHGFDAVQATLGVPTPSLVASARHGAWITEPPSLEDDSERAIVAAGGKQLVVDLTDGSLSARP